MLKLSSYLSEGVEFEYQKDIVLSNNCLEIQGYLYSKPPQVKDFENLLLLKS
jgi:diguanylate cyclase